MSLNLDIPDSPRLRDKLAALCLFILVFAGLAAGYWIGATRVPIAENISAAPAVRQADGSLVLARQPNPKPPAAPHAIPKGTTEVRRMTTTVKSSKADCPPVTLTTSLVQDGDGLRAVTSAEGGEVVEGTDAPIRALNLAPPPHLWAAGVKYEPFQRLYGAWVDRDIGRLRLGAEIEQRQRTNDAGVDIAVWMKAGINF